MEKQYQAQDGRYFFALVPEKKTAQTLYHRC